MKVLLAIMSCQAYTARAQAQRDTWVKDIPAGLDYKFFIGMNPGQPPYSFPYQSDTVVLDAPDDYLNFPAKVQAMRRWAHEQGYDWVVKIDDDVYLEPVRLLASVPEPAHHYVGRTRGPSGGFRSPYNSGFCYWLSRHALKLIKDVEWKRGVDDIAEDRWTANALFQRGISPVPDYRHTVCNSKKNALSGREAPLCDNQIISACEFSPSQLVNVHKDYKSGRFSEETKPELPNGALKRISVMIKTFHRDNYLYDCLRGLERQMPECQIIVVDDGLEHPNKITRYSELRARGHQTIWLPFDSGFGEKANAAIEHLKTEYVLVGSDDFDFANPVVRKGVILMQAVMDSEPELGIVSGRVAGTPYESCLDLSEPGVVRELKQFYKTKHLPIGTPYHFCDLTVNYSLIRKRVFDAGVRWDGGDVKIGGGEHGAFFLDVKEKGWKVAVVENAIIYELDPRQYGITQEYRTFRGRARTPGRPCLKKRGINKWILTDGREEIA